MSQIEQLKFRSAKKGVLVKCYNPECLYQWEYKGSMLYGCCPSCRHNVKVEYGSQFFKVNEKNNDSVAKLTEPRK